jgi:hypothetical protein
LTDTLSASQIWGAVPFGSECSQNCAEFAGVFIRENPAGASVALDTGLENAFFSKTFVPAPEVQLPISLKP